MFLIPVRSRLVPVVLYKSGNAGGREREIPHFFPLISHYMPLIPTLLPLSTEIPRTYAVFRTFVRKMVKKPSKRYAVREIQFFSEGDDT
jgi:hypothetical protein